MDIVARVVAGNITPHFGQTMIVENKAGGGGVVPILSVPGFSRAVLTKSAML